MSRYEASAAAPPEPARLLPDRAAGRHHHPGPDRGPGGAAPLRPRGTEQAGGRASADRAVRRGAGPVSARHRRLPGRGGRPAGAGAEPEPGQLERSISEEAASAARSLGPPVPVQVLPGRPRRLRHLDARRRRSPRGRRRKRRRGLLGNQVTRLDSPSPCPLPLRGRGVRHPSPLWGEGRVRGYSVRGYSVRGYSLVELVVVLAILAVAVAVVAPAVCRTADDVRVRAELAGLAAFLRTAREQAVTRQQALEVTLDPEARVLLLRRPGRDGEARVQASRAVSSLLRVEADPAMPRLTFLPHGMSSGARFTIEAPGPRAYVITVDPLTGRVTTQRAAL